MMGHINAGGLTCLSIAPVRSRIVMPTVFAHEEANDSYVVELPGATGAEEFTTLAYPHRPTVVEK